MKKFFALAIFALVSQPAHAGIFDLMIYGEERIGFLLLVVFMACVVGFAVWHAYAYPPCAGLHGKELRDCENYQVYLSEGGDAFKAYYPSEELEDHHIYPKRFLSPYGIKGERVNNIGNRTPLTRTTNSAIGNTAPHVYIIDAKVVGSEPIEPVISEHLIDSSLLHKPFTAEFFDQFISDRKKKILSAIGAAVHAEPITEQPDIV